MLLEVTGHLKSTTFQSNISRGCNTFLLTVWASPTTLPVSLRSDFPKCTMCTMCICRHAKLSVPPLGHYFHSLIVLSAFCSIIVIQIVLVLLSKHRWVTVPALQRVYSRNKPFKFSTQDKMHQLQPEQSSKIIFFYIFCKFLFPNTCLLLTQS